MKYGIWKSWVEVEVYEVEVDVKPESWPPQTYLNLKGQATSISFVQDVAMLCIETRSVISTGR